ncbi:kinase-like domain-containing protein [Mycena floridula]|nr:kinase-like domain-containing protein [Mycena floridula]
MSFPPVITGPELLVDDFLADVSCEVNIERETVETVSTVTEACFFGQSISVHEFIQQATASLKYYPKLARKLNTFLQASGERLELVLNELATVDLIVIHGPAGGQIYPVSDAIQVPAISNTATLRAPVEADRLEPHFTDAPSLAGAIAELLQYELKHSSLDTAYKTKCLRHLRRLALKKGVLPPSFFLSEIIYDGSRAIFGGGFADVYKGQLNGKVVCLKVLRFFVEPSEMAQELLIDCCREALVWKQLDHPNVLPFLGVNVEMFAPSFCLVSPWMSNGNLTQFLRRNPDFERRNVIDDIAAAMQYLYEYSPPIVHADIRCANVLVQDNLRCCLADFGLSSISASFSLTSSSSGNTKGSIRWMAPELFLTSRDGNELKSTSRDIYAFACTILEVYTGQHPFAQYKHDPPVIHDVLDGGRPPRPKNISDNLWTLVEACWHQDPTSRPDAQTVVNTLQTGSVDFIHHNKPKAPPIPQFAQSITPAISAKQKDFNLDKELPPIAGDLGATELAALAESSSAPRLTPLRLEIPALLETEIPRKPKPRSFWGFGRYLTATASEDWTLVLEVCERASVNDSNAKEAVRTLRREFRYGEPSAQLSAARLWAIMLRNSTETFISQSTSRIFLDTVEDLLESPRTSPVVRERVMDVVSAAAFASQKYTGFRTLWRKVKPPGKPDEGVPFDTDDAMFNPPVPTRNSQIDLPTLMFGDATPITPQSGMSLEPHQPTAPPPQTNHNKRRKSPSRHNRVIPLDQEIIDLTNSEPDSPVELTIEEKQLATLLGANAELLESLKQYDNFEHVRLERKAQDRSMIETRIDCRQLDEEGALIPTDTAARSSRSREPLLPPSSKARSRPRPLLTEARHWQHHHLPVGPRSPTCEEVYEEYHRVRTEEVSDDEYPMVVE